MEKAYPLMSRCIRVNVAEYLFSLVLLICGGGVSAFDINDELEALKEPGLIRYAALHGMRLEVYPVRTSDDWLLQLHRIRCDEVYNSELSAPVYLSHGFGSSSFDFMANPRNESLAFILADSGFDVWVANYRANVFSNLKFKDGVPAAPASRDYFRASWQYMAERDAPAFLEKILEETKQDKVYVSGTSMGTTVMFALLSENHAFDDKIAHFAALVPVLRFGNDTALSLKSALVTAPKLLGLLIWPVFKMIFGTQLMASKGGPMSDAFSYVETRVCLIVPSLCELLQNLMNDRKLTDSFSTNPHYKQSRAPIYASRGKGGTTMMNAFNYAMQMDQEVWTKIDFRRFPQTGITNEQEYNAPQPPAYDFSNTNVEFSMYYTSNDIFTGVETAKNVIADMKPSFFKIVQDERFSHIDILNGWDARCFVFDGIIDIFDTIERRRSPERDIYRMAVVRPHLQNLTFENGCNTLRSIN